MGINKSRDEQIRTRPSCSPISMGVSSKVCVAFVLGLLLMGTLLQGEARNIGYVPIEEGDKDHKCKGSKCLPGSSNSYRRGCVPIERCRGRKETRSPPCGDIKTNG